MLHAHTINLTVNDPLDVVQHILEKGRHVVTFFNAVKPSIRKTDEISNDNGITVPKKLIQDVPTRWNSSYYMLERQVSLEDALKTPLALSDKSAFNLTPDE